MKIMDSPRLLSLNALRVHAKERGKWDIFALSKKNTTTRAEPSHENQ